MKCSNRLAGIDLRSERSAYQTSNRTKVLIRVRPPSFHFRSRLLIRFGLTLLFSEIEDGICHAQFMVSARNPLRFPQGIFNR
jgi:hypothetical protein